MKRCLFSLLVIAAIVGCALAGETNVTGKATKSDAEWREELTPEQYRVLRQKGTEQPFCGALWNHHEKGVYVCAACGAEVFRSDEKFDSGTGWPSYWAPVEGSVTTHVDRTHGMVRTEALCGYCGSHLGHVFDDGPPPTGLRYCVNSAALKFKREDPKK